MRGKVASGHIHAAFAVDKSIYRLLLDAQGAIISSSFVPILINVLAESVFVFLLDASPPTRPDPETIVAKQIVPVPPAPKTATRVSFRDCAELKRQLERSSGKKRGGQGFTETPYSYKLNKGTGEEKLIEGTIVIGNDGARGTAAVPQGENGSDARVNNEALTGQIVIAVSGRGGDALHQADPSENGADGGRGGLSRVLVGNENTIAVLAGNGGMGGTGGPPGIGEPGRGGAGGKGGLANAIAGTDTIACLVSGAGGKGGKGGSTAGMGAVAASGGSGGDGGNIISVIQSLALSTEPAATSTARAENGGEGGQGGGGGPLDTGGRGGDGGSGGDVTFSGTALELKGDGSAKAGQGGPAGLGGDGGQGTGENGSAGSDGTVSMPE